MKDKELQFLHCTTCVTWQELGKQRQVSIQFREEEVLIFIEKSNKVDEASNWY